MARTSFQLVIAALGPLLRSTTASTASVDGGACRMQKACRGGTVPSLANAIRSALRGSCAKQRRIWRWLCWSCSETRLELASKQGRASVISRCKEAVAMQTELCEMELWVGRLRDRPGA